MLQKAQFLKSAAAWKDLPPEGGKEIAFWGRSNSGKSSTLNTLCQQKSLARASRTPGRTTLLNYFEVIPNRYLVDLPGYGFAKTSRQAQALWGKEVGDYIERRHSLVGVILLMDIRHPLTDTDKPILKWLISLRIPTHIILNKADKLGYGAQQQTLKKLQAELKSKNITIQTFSAHNGQNKDQLEQKILEWFEIT